MDNSINNAINFISSKDDNHKDYEMNLKSDNIEVIKENFELLKKVPR